MGIASGAKNVIGLVRKSQGVPGQMTNIIGRKNALASVDNFPIRDVAQIGDMPFFILDQSSLGYAMRLNLMHAKAWGEAERMSFISKIESALQLDNQESPVNYSYAFTLVRSNLDDRYFQQFRSRSTNHLHQIRLDYAHNMAEALRLQRVDLVLSIVATPSDFLIVSKVGITERIQKLYDAKKAMEIENRLFEQIYTQFADKIQNILAMLGSRGVRFSAPTKCADLLDIARSAWRPFYRPSKLQEKLSLSNSHYSSASAFMCEGLNAISYRDHWLSDGNLNIMLSLKEPPDYRTPFSALAIDKLIMLGVRPGISLVPYSGIYTVAFSSLTKLEGDKIFKKQSLLAKAMASDREGYFEDKQANKEARTIAAMHDQYWEDGSDMVRGSVTYTISIPLRYLHHYANLDQPKEEDVRASIIRTTKMELESIGGLWDVEDMSYHTAWVNSMPGAIRVSANSQYLPRTYLPLNGALHFVPFYATVSPDQNAYNGSNYFMTEEGTIFTFDLFSKSHGNASNFAICGSTGSGKSVTAQVMAMMLAKDEPYMMVLDFGGGNVGSWTKLCSVWGGIELKFGSANPPRINPFELAVNDALPNKRKKARIIDEIADEMRGMGKPMPSNIDDLYTQIDELYLYLRGDDDRESAPSYRLGEWTKKMPVLGNFSNISTLLKILQLDYGLCKPGDKGLKSLKTVLTLLLASDIDKSGTADTWNHFMQDDIDEAIRLLYEEHAPELGRWPQLSDFKASLEKLQKNRMVAGKPQIHNYYSLINKLESWCVGGLDAFVDGQTNVNVYEKTTDENGIVTQRPARFILADMAHIQNMRKQAIYMIIINDFMSNILYNNFDRRGVIIRDEAWLFMDSPIAAPYLHSDYRLARKYGFSVGTISQNYSDFKSSVILANTQIWIVCALGSEEEIHLANSRFHFSQSELEAFSSNVPGVMMGNTRVTDFVHNRVQDAYARIMIATVKSGKFFIINKVSQIELWITTTEPDETFVYNYYRVRNKEKSVIEMLKWLCTREYQHDQALIAALEKAHRKMPQL